MLQQLADSLWVTHRPLRFLGAELGTRMTVIRLKDGGLFVHSPVLLDRPTRTDLDILGPVRLVVAPSLFHHLFVADCMRLYPRAKLFGAPGLDWKRSDLKFDAVLDDVPPPEWVGQIDQVVFRVLAPLNEVVFFHRDSRTLIVSDLLFNIRTSESRYTRVLLKLNGGLGRVTVLRPIRWRTKMRRARARATLNNILSWDFDRLVLAHGEVVAGGAKELVRAAWSFL